MNRIMSTPIIPLDLMRLDKLQMPVPRENLFEGLFGYGGNNRYVSFYYIGNELYIDDGREEFFGEHVPFGAWLEHPIVSPMMDNYNLGSPDQDYEHWLVLDRVKRRLYVGDWRLARNVMKRQRMYVYDPPLTQLSFDDFPSGNKATVVSDPEKPTNHKAMSKSYQRYLDLTGELISWMDEKEKATQNG